MSEPNKTEQGAQVLYEYLRARTTKSQVTGKKHLMAHPPQGLEKEELSALLATLGTADVPEALQAVAVVNGRKDVYLYEGNLMTKHYAELDTLVQEKDILRTIATVTRSDSALYPRPTQFSKLMNIPFRFTLDEILGAEARMKFEEQYADIGVVEASNGAKAFFSRQSLSDRYARALLEGIEVEDPENP